MNKLRNTILQLKMLWYVVFLLALSLNVHAGSEEIVSLFTPVPSIAVASDDAASGMATPGSQQEVVINLIPLKSGSEAYGKMRMDFLDRRIIVRRTKSLPGLKGSVTWIGRPEGEEGSIVMSVCGNALFGQIELKDEVYKIEPVRDTNTHRIIKLDHDKEVLIDEGGLIPPERQLSEKKGAIPVIPKGTDDGAAFDVLVLYTKGFADTYPGDELYAQINYLIGVANACYSNSEVNLTARVAGIKKVKYKDRGKLGNALNDLTNGSGVFSGVAALRDRLGADLVVLLRVFKDNNDSCGLAWQMTSLNTYFEKNAFSVVQVGRIALSETSFKFCSDQTMAHEMGHNMGCAHEDGSGAVFQYSKGYVFSPYMSVMATSGGTRVSYFSNPNVTYSGLATGTSDNNNARSIKKVKLTISQFRDSVCNGSIAVSPAKLTLYKEESDEITVTVNSGDDYPSAGETVKVTINTAGKKIVSVSPSSATIDSGGQATFTITALGKKGIARIHFKSGCLKKTMTVKVREQLS